MEYQSYINAYLQQEIALLQRLDQAAIERFLAAVLEAHGRGATIYIFGNGGSAATASHFANDFNKGISEYTEQKFHFRCLNDNTPTVLAIANDIGYERIFSFQLEGNVTAGDLVIGISGSGNSPNVLHAIETARRAGALTVGLSGYDGGKLAKLADISVHVPSNSMQLVEDVHMILDHLLMTVCYQLWNINGH